MKAYVVTSGTIFALLVLAHLARMIGESAALARDPSYLLITLSSAAMSVWAFTSLRRRNVASRRGGVES